MPPSSWKILPLVVDLRLGPQRLDELDAFAKPPDAMLTGVPGSACSGGPAQADAEDRAAVAHVVERGHLVRDVDGVVDWQDGNRHAEADSVVTAAA